MDILKATITPVILCGGSGTRLWPLSRSNYPKQFLKFNNSLTLFQQSIKRALQLQSNGYLIEEILIVTNEDHRFLVLEQISSMNINIKYRIILEPTSLNTAPSLTLAAFASPNSILVVTPADHYLKGYEEFRKSIHTAVKNLEIDTIFTIGIRPNNPSSSYGYICFEGNKKIKNVISFKEKPSEKIAMQMIKKNNCLWNAGIFILNSKTWLSAISKVNNKMYQCLEKSWKKKIADNLFERPNNKDFCNSPSDSIDFSVMENANSINLNIKMIQMKSIWFDLGEHKSLENIYKKNNMNNILEGDVVENDSKNILAISTTRNISLLGVEDLIIIDTKDALLIANKNNHTSMRDLIKKLKKLHKNILKEHSKIYRPWGWFDLIIEERKNKIKKITVKPKSELSYQSHKYRNEHWIVLSGIATIKQNGKIYKIKKDESTYIKKGDKHKLMNKENIDLEIIEVQTGEKVSEEDIVRYDDMYGRS